jgi:hypothetical protein
MAITIDKNVVGFDITIENLSGKVEGYPGPGKPMYKAQIVYGLDGQAAFSHVETGHVL